MMNTANQQRIGLGLMGMSGMYGKTDDAESIRTIHAAIERGVTFMDTGDFYGMGHNEMLLGKAIAGRRDKVQISVKFGGLRGPDNGWYGFDARPAAVKNFLAYTLKRLGVEAIDIYRPARLDPAVPIEDTIGAIAEMVKAGYVKAIGLSEVGVDTIRRAHRVHPIADLQIEYSLASRGPEEKIFPVLEELGIGATLYGVLSRGLLAGSKPQGPTDFRAYLPRFQAEKNAAFIGALQGFARQKGMTPGQLAIAWVLAKTPRFMPIIGAKTTAQLEDALGAKPLTAADLVAIEALGNLEGTRYGAEQMAHLDSEK
jgi:aryl-alcohol dehydrogenase-like predicted oxidoreductase